MTADNTPVLLEPPEWGMNEVTGEWEYRSRFIALTEKAMSVGPPTAHGWYWAVLWPQTRSLWRVEVWRGDDWTEVAEGIPDLDTAKAIAVINANVSVANMDPSMVLGLR